MTRIRHPKALNGLLGLAAALILAGLWKGTRHETQFVNGVVNEISDLRDPSPFRAALMGHLGKIQLSLKGYLGNPDPSLEKQIGQSRAEFESLLPEFVKQNPKLFPQKAAEEIGRSFGLFNEAIARTLESNAHRLGERTELESRFTRILYLINHDLRPLIRKQQADSEERGEAILNIENQTRAWQQNLAYARAQPTEATKALTFENDNRGQTFLENYAELELLPRERKIQKEIRAVWLANSNLARKSFVEDNVVSQMEKTMDETREQLIASLNQFLPAMPPGELEAKKQALMRSMKLRVAGALGIGLLGLGLLITIALTSYRLSRTQPRIADGIFRIAPSGDSARGEESTLQMDLQGIITVWTLAAEALYGYKAEEVCGKSIESLFESESEIGRLDHELHVAKKTTFETRHKTKNGGSISVRIEFRPVIDSSGQTASIGLVCTRQNIQ